MLGGGSSGGMVFVEGFFLNVIYFFWRHLVCFVCFLPLVVLSISCSRYLIYFMEE